MGFESIDAYLQGPWLVAALAFFGMFVGVLTGLFGVGGGFMVTPMLSVLFGMDYNAMAVGSSLCFMIGTSVSGVARHIRMKNLEPRSMFALGLLSILGAVLGGYANDGLKAGLGADNYSVAVDWIFILILALTAWVVGRGAGKEEQRRSLLQRLPGPPRINLPAADRTDVSLVGLCMVGLGIGLLTGLLGIGGGVLFMPLLIVVVGLTPHQAVGTSLGVVVFSSVAGTIKYGLADKVSLVVAMSLLVGAAVGVQVGAWLCVKIHGTRLRKYFALLVLAVAAVLIARSTIELVTG